MDQDNNSISWKDLPWKKFQRKIFHLQCKIYKAKQADDYKNVKRFQKLLIKSKSTHFLASREMIDLCTKKGFFLSDDTKLNIVNNLDSIASGWRALNSDSFFKSKESYFYLSLVRDKVLPYILKLAIEPLYGIYIQNSKDFKFELSKKELINFTKSTTVKAKKILAINFRIELRNIKYHFLMKRILLPSKYKVYLYNVLKLGLSYKKTNFNKNDTDSLSSFLLPLFLNDFYPLNGETKLTINSSNFLVKKSAYFCSDYALFFLRNDQDECRFLSSIRDFFDVSGIGLEVKDLCVSNMKVGYKFLNWHFRLKHNRIIVYPHNNNLNNLRAKLISILKTEKNNLKTNIKIISYLIKRWYNSHSICLRLRLKSYLYYLTGLIIRYIKKSTKFTKSRITKLFTYFLSSYS